MSICCLFECTNVAWLGLRAADGFFTHRDIDISYTDPFMASATAVILYSQSRNLFFSCLTHSLHPGQCYVCVCTADTVEISGPTMNKRSAHTNTA